MPVSMQKRRQYIGSHHSSRDARRPRTNEQIATAEVLLVTDEGSRKVSLAEAIAQAREAELDLIEIAGKVNPPVVKIGDIGQYLYQQQKKERKQKSGSKQTEVKMLRFGFRTDQHDLDRLVDRAKEFLTERHLVKFVVRLRGRELGNKSFAVDKLKGVVAALQEDAEVEQEMRMQGNNFVVVLRARK
ncbi:translation initiation factor IF-3 [Candidatus Peribacteria bacterium]|nr:translation initiation factor IF-3 [Candidatus Peribacteria bacterium]